MVGVIHVVRHFKAATMFTDSTEMVWLSQEIKVLSYTCFSGPGVGALSQT